MAFRWGTRRNKSRVGVDGDGNSIGSPNRIDGGPLRSNRDEEATLHRGSAVKLPMTRIASYCYKWQCCANR